MTPSEIGTINATVEVLEWYRDTVLALSLAVVGNRADAAFDRGMDLQRDMGNKAAAVLAYIEKMRSQK